jgi:probable O-glycosylation ligase (exosortase A-associated)
MPIRDLTLIGIIIISLPVSFLRPWIGILVWTWVAYFNPHRFSWGIAYDFPVAQVIAIAVIGGLLFSKERNPLPKTREIYILIGLWGIFFLSTLFAAYPDDAWPMFTKVSKILLMIFVTLLLFQDTKKLNLLLWVTALSIGFFGLKGGIWAVFTGGRHMVLGPPRSAISGNTEIGLALIMLLPIFVLLRRMETRTWLRLLLLATFGFSIVAIVVTYSRGALVGLAAVISILLWRSRHRLLLLFVLPIGVYLLLTAMPGQWFDRMETIQTYEQDMSAMGRIVAWKLSYRLAQDRPFLGFGFRCFTEEIYNQYMHAYPYHATKAADAHSIFFQVLAEHGYSGLILFAGLIFYTVLSLRAISRKANGDASLKYYYDFAQMLEVSLVGYLVSGLFLSRSYFDLFFQLVAMAIILKQLFINAIRIQPELESQKNL